jgi:hypothetical protein
MHKERNGLAFEKIRRRRSQGEDEAVSGGRLVGGVEMCVSSV